MDYRTEGGESIVVDLRRSSAISTRGPSDAMREALEQGNPFLLSSHLDLDRCSLILFNHKIIINAFDL